MALKLAAVLGAVLLLSMTAPLLAQDAVVTGTVALRGEPLKPREFKTPEGVAFIDESELVDARTGGLRNVLVWVKSGVKPLPAGPMPDVRLEAAERQFRPRIVALRPDQKLVVVNTDDHQHCVHIAPVRSRETNVHLTRGNSCTSSFGKPEMSIPVTVLGGCRWMKAWIFVIEHAHHAVTDATGAFTLPALPPGEYEISAWHENHGEVARTVVLKAGDNKVEFDLKRQ